MEKRYILKDSYEIGFVRKDFELEKFIEEIDSLPTLWAKLEKFNEYIDLIQRKKTSIDTSDGTPLFLLECSACEGRYKGKDQPHDKNNEREIRRFIYEKAREAAAEFKEMPYKKRVQSFFDRFGEGGGYYNFTNVESIWHEIDIDYVKEQDYPPSFVEKEKSEKAIISIKPKEDNNEERLILNTFHYERLYPEYEKKFEERKTIFKKKFHSLMVLTETEKDGILKQEEQNIYDERNGMEKLENATGAEKGAFEMLVKRNLSTPVKGFTDYAKRIGEQESIDLSKETIFENGEMHSYLKAIFHVKYTQFIKSYSIQSKSPNIEAVEGKKESEIQLFHREIALLHYYTEIPLNDNNANEKAKIYGQGSGVKLMQHYNEITKGSLNITNHRFAVKNITNVILLLNNYPKGKEKAENDLKIAKTKKN